MAQRERGPLGVKEGVWHFRKQFRKSIALDAPKTDI